MSGKTAKLLPARLTPTDSFSTSNSTCCAAAPRPEPHSPKNNTTLVAVVTNAALSQEALFIVAKMATAGFARSISPALSPWDGDLIFSVSAGQVRSDVTLVGTIAAEATRLAILDAVRESRVVG